MIGKVGNSMKRLGEETKRVIDRINLARRMGLRSTEISLDPGRRAAVEWNLKQMGFAISTHKFCAEHTVISWKR